MQEETKSSQKAEMKVVDKLKHTGAITAPSLFTLGNLACGFFSILAAAKGHFAQAGWLILFAAVFDMFDGRVACWARKATLGWKWIPWRMLFLSAPPRLC